MQDRPTERVRVLLDGLTASAIVERIHPYYNGYQFEGEWLDGVRGSIDNELDDLDRIVRETGDPAGARAFAERLETAVAERADVTLFGVDYMTYPLDADGVPIHVEDVLDGYGKTIEVVELRTGRSGWVLISRDGNGYADCAAFSHHHAPTVEDVLREYAIKCEEAGNSGPEVKRLAAEYAARLMLAGEDA